MQIKELQELVPLCNYERDHKIVTNWGKVSKIMNRTPTDCQNKWIRMQTKKLKKGPFTAEEDAIIKQRVPEWTDKGNGLWVSLEKELRRSAKSIGDRWETLNPEFNHGPWSQAEVDLFAIYLLISNLRMHNICNIRLPSWKGLWLNAHRRKTETATRQLPIGMKCHN